MSGKPVAKKRPASSSRAKPAAVVKPEKVLKRPAGVGDGGDGDGDGELRDKELWVLLRHDCHTLFIRTSIDS